MNEKTRKGCELKQVLAHGTELACVTRRLTRGPENEQRSGASSGAFVGFRISILFLLDNLTLASSHDGARPWDPL